MPPDTEVTPVSRTIGADQLVDDDFKFTHTMRMDWMLPGIPPTGKRVEVPLVAIVVSGATVAHEHIYWDQASVLVQLGLLDSARLPVAGIETARKLWTTRSLRTRWRQAILDKLRELAQVDDDRWEQIINEPMLRPKLKAFIEQATAEGSEPLDLNRM